MDPRHGRDERACGEPRAAGSEQEEGRAGSGQQAAGRGKAETIEPIESNESVALWTPNTAGTSGRVESWQRAASRRKEEPVAGSRQPAAGRGEGLVVSSAERPGWGR